MEKGVPLYLNISTTITAEKQETWTNIISGLEYSSTTNKLNLNSRSCQTVNVKLQEESRSSRSRSVIESLQTCDSSQQRRAWTSVGGQRSTTSTHIQPELLSLETQFHKTQRNWMKSSTHIMVKWVSDLFPDVPKQFQIPLLISRYLKVRLHQEQ